MRDVSGLSTARVMNDCSIAGHDTNLCDEGGSDALPVLRVCFTCSVVFRPSGKEKVYLFKTVQFWRSRVMYINRGWLSFLLRSVHVPGMHRALSRSALYEADYFPETGNRFLPFIPQHFPTVTVFNS